MPNQFNVRLGDKDECQHYSSCLYNLAKLEGKSGYRANNLKLPCEDCTRYCQIAAPELTSFRRIQSVFETAL